MSDAFWEQLSPRRLTEIIDVGANPVDGEPPYGRMLSAGLCRVLGFEPQEQAFAELQANKGPHERFLPYAVGDGNAHTLNVYRGSGLTSLFDLDPSKLELFQALKPPGELVHRLPLSTRRLDDISEIDHLDFLKIDVQGSELAVFQGGTRKLAQAVAIQVEVSFVTLYKDQPAFGAIDLELRGQGFIPHCFVDVKRWPIAPCVINGDPRQPMHQLLEADIVYVRDFSRPESMSDEQLKHLALIAHHCYGSVDLALRCVMLLEQRGVLRPGAQNRYLEGNPVPWRQSPQ
jgi:FkbM family methyltransferase